MQKKELKLFHGTVAYFDKVDLSMCKDHKDFGKGFYMTSDLQQAVNFALYKKKLAIIEGNVDAKAFVYMIKISEESLEKLNYHRFKGANLSWLDYILKNRKGTTIKDDYDVVYGKVADAEASKLINEFISEYGWNASDEKKLVLIKKLKPEVLRDQYCFKTSKAEAILNECIITRKEYN